MDSNLKNSVQKELNKIQAPDSLYKFAFEVPDLVEKGEVTVRKKKKGFKKTIYGVTAAVACSALFMFGVNLSPSFASYVEKIPVLSQISKYVAVDKAAENGLMKDVAYSATDQNITFTIDNVITDSKRTILLYHVTMDKTDTDVKSLRLENFTITDGNDQLIMNRKDGSFTKAEDNPFSPRWILSPGELESDDPSKLVGMMELISQEGTASVPKELKLSIDDFSPINHKGELLKTIAGTWEISVPLNVDDIATKPVEYGEQSLSIEVDNQNLDLQINYTKVYPTITEMSMDLVTEIDGGIIYDYHLEDENGVVYKHIEDGIMTDTGDVLPQFESSYFNESNTLYLVINKVTTTTRIGDSFKDETFEVNKKVKLNK